MASMPRSSFWRVDALLRLSNSIRALFGHPWANLVRDFGLGSFVFVSLVGSGLFRAYKKGKA